ncbi:hypothetical protein ABIE26_002120 [Pedobacter africanus]
MKRYTIYVNIYGVIIVNFYSGTSEIHIKPCSIVTRKQTGQFPIHLSFSSIGCGRQDSRQIALIELPDPPAIFFISDLLSKLPPVNPDALKFNFFMSLFLGLATLFRMSYVCDMFFMTSMLVIPNCVVATQQFVSRAKKFKKGDI